MTTTTIYVKVLTVDTRRGEMIPVPNARLLCQHERFLWDPDISSGNDVTDANGLALVDLTYNEDDANNLNPCFTITLPEANRAIPDPAPANEQFTLPDEWETRHYVRRRLAGILNYTNIDEPLDIYIGLPGRLQLSYTDFDSSNIRNPIAIPQHTLRFYLSDNDIFFDDTITGVGYDHSAGIAEDKYIPIGTDDRYPYHDVWPTVETDLPTPAASPKACIDPPEAPTGRLGQGSFQTIGPLATDLHGFVFIVDGNLIRRFYPNGYLCETINYSFDSPGGLAVDQYRNLYVADTGNDRIVVFRLNNADGQSGDYVYSRRVGSSGNGNLQFNNPTDLTVVPRHEVDQDEWLAVADTGNHRVQIIRLNFTAFGNSIRVSMGPGLAMPYLSQFGAPAVASGASDVNPVAQALWEPVAISSDRNRCLYVADKSWHRVSKWCVNAAGTGYDHDADWEKAGGGSGNGNREFDTPVSLALDPTHLYLYVGEAANNRIQRINGEDGTHLCHWQPNMGPDGIIPTGIAVDNRGEIYVSDSANRKVLRGSVYAANGNVNNDGDTPNQVGDLWQSRLTDDHMYAPAYVAHNKLDKSLWVSDSGNNRIKVYRLDAEFALNPAAAPAADGFNNPVGITFDASTTLIADSGNNRIRSYGGDLSHQEDTGNTWSNQPGTLATDSAGNFYVVGLTSHRIQKLNSSGELIISWGRHGKRQGEFDQPHSVAIDSSDNIYVSDGGNHRVQKFDNNGVYIIEWGGEGSQDGEFDDPKGIAIDSSDNVFVVDNNNYRVQKFDAAGVFISSFGTFGSANKEFRSPIGITIDSTNHIYVSDDNLHEVKKFDASYGHLNTLGGPGSGNADGQFDSPQGLSVDNSDNIYVADKDNHRFQKFNSSGAFQDKGGTHGNGDGELDGPTGLVINNASDKVFVADTNNNRIQEFDLNGAFVSKWGEGGTGDNEFNNPRGIEYVTRENGAALYVAEQGNNRIKRIDTHGGISHLTEAAAGDSLSNPGDVASDSAGYLYVADTGKNRILKYDGDDNYLREITPTDASLAFSAPSGISIVENKSQNTTVIELLVTDRGNNRILLMDQTGAVLAYWDFMNFVRQQVTGVTSSGTPIVQRTYDTELSRLITLDSPSNAVLDSHGLLIISDTNHDQVRLLRIHTDFHANLFDLGETQPDISICCEADVDWQDELGLRASAGPDNSVSEVETSPVDDYSEDSYFNRHHFNHIEKMHSATNALKVARQAQRWLRHITREDDAGHRWEDKELELYFNLSSSRGSKNGWGSDTIKLGEDPSGRSHDAWDDSTIVHEMGHWIFDSSCHPDIPYARVGGTHQRRDIISPNLAFTEAYAEYHQMFWASGNEYSNINPIRGFKMSGGSGTLINIRAVQYDDNKNPIPGSIVPQYLYGGPPAAAAPTFNDPEKGMQNEGYHANTLWQMHHALIEPEILFADATCFWYRHNNHLTRDKSQLFCNIFRQALRDFPESPPREQNNNASRQYLLQVLGRAYGIDPDIAQIIQSIYEVNNQLMPVITVSEQIGGSAGPAIDQINVASGTAKTLIIQVKNAIGESLPGYNIKITIQTGNPNHYALDAAPNPDTLHGRHTPAPPLPANELYLTTDGDGEISLTCTVPGATPAAAETLVISYQPDFDTDATFSPPVKNDTLGVTLQKLYLHELRWVGKTWSGTGNNFGAIVEKTFTVNIT